MKTEKYKNRYNDEYTFTELENGNIQWSGPFKYLRWGCPNDYNTAYRKYLEDEGNHDHMIGLDEFKEKVHDYNYDTKKYHPIAEKYGKLVTSNQNIINMVDPSGGPYLAEGMEVLGKTIVEFKANKKGYEIICK